MRSLAFACLLAAGCSVMSLAPKDGDAVARQLLRDLADGKFDAVRAQVPAEKRAAVTDALLQANAEQLRSIASIELAGFHWTLGAAHGGELDYQIHSAAGWSLARLLLVEENGRLTVADFGLARLDDDLRRLNAFTVRGRGTAQWVLAGWAVVELALIVFALVRCARSSVRRKVLWLIFIALGLTRLAVDWTTGDLDVQIANLSLLGVGLWRATPLAPWVLTTSLPLGAILFLALGLGRPVVTRARL